MTEIAKTDLSTWQSFYVIIGAATLGLLLIGIRNARDAVTCMAIVDSHADSAKTERSGYGHQGKRLAAFRQATWSGSRPASRIGMAPRRPRL